MDRAGVEELLEESRHVAMRGGEGEFLERVVAGIESTDDGALRGLLQLARAIAGQRCEEPAVAAEWAKVAVELLTEAGQSAPAVSAMANVAVFLQRAGELDEAVETAVACLARLDDLPVDNPFAARAAHSLGVLFGQLHAFSLSVQSSRRALRSPSLSGQPGVRIVIEFSLGMFSARAAELMAAGTGEWLAAVGAIEDACLWLEGEDDPTARVIATGLRGELDFIDGKTPNPERLAAVESDYEHSASFVAAWHRFVRGRALRQLGRPEEAIAQLEDSFDFVTAIGDERVRRELGMALNDAGRFEDAAEQLVLATDEMERVHRDHVGRMARDLNRRVDAERAEIELRRHTATLATQVSLDHLTNVASRRALDERLDRPIEADEESAVLVCDLDHFKLINDSFGHEAGDQVLARVGEILTRSIRDVDFVGRLGGEEFVVVAPSDAGQAVEIAERIRIAVESEDWSAIGDELNLTISIGVAGGNLELRDLLRAADLAVYAAKRDGRNCVRVADREDLADAAAVA